jgi:hypothetical protein
MNYWMQISQEEHTNGYLGTSPIFNLIEDRPFVAIRREEENMRKLQEDGGWVVGARTERSNNRHSLRESLPEKL